MVATAASTEVEAGLGKAEVTMWRDAAWQSEHGNEGNRPLRDRPGNRLRWEDELRKHTAHAQLGPWVLMALSALTGVGRNCDRHLSHLSEAVSYKRHMSIPNPWGARGGRANWVCCVVPSSPLHEVVAQPEFTVRAANCERSSCGELRNWGLAPRPQLAGPGRGSHSSRGEL